MCTSQDLKAWLQNSSHAPVVESAAFGSPSMLTACVWGGMNCEKRGLGSTHIQFLVPAVTFM